MTESDALVTQFLSMQPWRYKDVEHLALERVRDDGDGHWAIDLTLMLVDPDRPEDKFSITFHSVQELRLATPGYIQLTQLEVRPIRDRQWEGLHYKVWEEEDQQLEFYCDTYDFRLVS